MNVLCLFSESVPHASPSAFPHLIQFVRVEISSIGLGEYQNEADDFQEVS